MTLSALQGKGDMQQLADALNSEFDTSQWPSITKVGIESDVLALHLHIAPDLKWFEGHFPDNPVLPGVVQVHWAVSLAKKLLVADKQFNKVENLKFKSVVLPNMDLVLRFTEMQAGEKIRFSFLSADSSEVHSEGRLSFG